ncbi:MAG: PBP1A family penicillin-binding protein [Gemmatimonadota bacterium]|nr:PBP1A family penicillin-binding protein [Gemmatimonadota bacterium]
MARRRIRRRARSGRARGLTGRLTAAWGAFPPEWLRPYWKPRANLLALAFLFAVGVGTAWGSWQSLCAACPSVAQIRTWEPEETSKLYSHDGVLIGELGIERRTAVSLAALPPHVPQAVIAIEDKRFYRHGGLDVRGVARAAFGVVTFNRRGGGSTITQQLARIMFQEDVIDFERRLLSGGLLRKLRELQVALELERSYTKDQILEAYLNQIYLGRAYGVQAGARAFLGKDAIAMNPAESALIAAILNVPGRYDPFRRPDNALQRRNLVLAQMADQGYLTEQEAQRWRVEPLPDESQLAGGAQDIAPYFQEWVRQILDSMYGQEVYSGGLNVTTTLDVAMQQAADEAMEFGWRRIEDLATFEHPKYAEFDTVTTFPGETPYLQGAFVALDPYTGAVRALIGGRNYRQSKFDRARQARRQAGSSFKPFVYTAAIQSGIPASHVIVDAPVVYPQVSGTEWRPQNYAGRFEGPMTIREGLRRSVNMVAIKLGWEEVGIETVAQTARRMGITTQIERFPSTTIGAVEVIPLEVVEAYSAYATLGTRVRPFPIVRVENAEGELLWEPQPERTLVLDSLVARLMVDLLQDAANRGTGGGMHTPGPNGGNLPWEVPTAGKTGTTNDGTDVWFTGFTSNLIASVWFGLDRPQMITPRATGGGFAAPTWGRFMAKVYYGDSIPPTGGPADAGSFEPDSTVAPQPDSVPSAGHASVAIHPGASLPLPDPWPVLRGLTNRQVDVRTGRLWSEWCRGEEYTEYYVPGTEPTEICDDTGRGRFRLPRIGRGTSPPAPSGQRQ